MHGSYRGCRRGVEFRYRPFSILRPDYLCNSHVGMRDSDRLLTWFSFVLETHSFIRGLCQNTRRDGAQTYKKRDHAARSLLFIPAQLSMSLLFSSVLATKYVKTSNVGY